MLLFPAGGCVDSLYILAFTSDLDHAGSDKSHEVVMSVKGVVGMTVLPNLPGDDYLKNKGDLWKLSLKNDFHVTYSCVKKGDIDWIEIEEHSNDGWNIASIVTFLRDGSLYEVATIDFNVNRWIDGDGPQSHKRFRLNKVL